MADCWDKGKMAQMALRRWEACGSLKQPSKLHMIDACFAREYWENKSKKIRPDCGKVQVMYVGQLSLSHTNHALLGSKLSTCLLEDPFEVTSFVKRPSRVRG